MPVTRPAPGASSSYMSQRGERRELEERRAGIEQPVDPLAHRQLALLAMALQVLRAAALRAPRAVRSRSSATSCCIRSRLAWNSVAVDVVGRAVPDVDASSVYQPQQSVLKPQAGQRQTACMRYISAAAALAEHLVVVGGGVTV